MSPELGDNTWMHSGVSVLWDAESLNELCPARSVRSLREFLRLHKACWPEDDLRLLNKRALIVAGLEAAMDTLPPDDAVEWLEQKIYPAIRDFQDNVADGGGEAALIFWLADAKRFWHRAADNTNHWYCSGEHRQHSIPIGRCLWNGAEASVQRVVARKPDDKARHVGLFLRRIS
jgi:hypothetical protein